MSDIILPPPIVSMIPVLMASAGAFLLLYPTIKTFARKSRTVDWELKLRDLQQDGGEMINGATNPNMFGEEFNQLFLTITETLDFAVMKYVDQDCRLLVRQEQRHAKMHKQGKKANHQPVGRFWILGYIFDRLLLRTGQTFGTAMALGVETLSVMAFYSIIINPAMSGFTTDVTLFHLYEEVEHGALTVQVLRKKCPYYARILAFPFLVLLAAVLFLGPAITLLVKTPLLPIHHPFAILDLIEYMAVFVPTTIVAFYILASQYLSPFVLEDFETLTKVQGAFHKVLKERNIRYEVVETEKYKLVCL